MCKTTNAFIAFAAALMLGSVTLAQQAQARTATGQTPATDDMMKKCVEHCQAAARQAGNQTNDKQSMGCMAMMAMQNGSEMKDMPPMADMPGMTSGAQHGGSVPAPTQQNPRVATSVRELERVCGQKVDPRTAPKSTFNGKTYYFCAPEDKARFDQNPEEFVGERLRQAPRGEAGQTRRRRC